MAVNVNTEISYWQDGAKESLEFADMLVSELQHFGPSLFWAHLALEKTLKAHVCKETKEIAPRLHDLVKLAEIGKIELQPEQVEFFQTMNFYFREGNYLGLEYPEPSEQQTREYINRAKEMIYSLQIPLAE